MINVSNEFSVLVSNNTDLLIKATLKLADGTTVNLTGEDIMSGSVSFTDASSADSSFTIGAAVINKFECTLYNYDDRFSDYDFANSEIVPYVGADLSDGTTEWIIKGYYGVQQPDSYSNTIRIEAYDNMRLLERPYSDVSTTYPATLQKIVREICSTCGVTLLSTQFANSSYVVATRPDDSASLNCQAVLSYAMQVSCNFARFDNNGRLKIDWYDAGDFDESSSLDGGYFDASSPFASGDAADGGGFMTGGDTVDGGGFTSRKFAVISNYSDLTVMTDDVVITGVRVTAQDYAGEESEHESGETVLYGASGYVLGIAGNPLILFGQASTVAEMIGARVVGLRFRPFTASPLGNPAIEAGDAAIIIDAKDNVYQTFITSYTFNLGGYAGASCNAESPGRNTASMYSAMVDAIIANRREIRREKTDREIAMENFQHLVETSSGLYETDVEQPDGSIIHYYHDKKTLAESELLWRFSAETFAVSSDGGETWLGLDAWGNAILNTIYAIGLDADNINTGSITVLDPYDQSNVIFEADISGGTVTIGGRTGAQLNAAVDKAASDATAASNAVTTLNNNLNQSEILRRLTGGYTTDGLYLRDGHIYLNASAINSGILTVIDPTTQQAIFAADVTNGTVSINAPSVLIGTRQAFANDASNVTVNSGTVTFNSNTFVVNSDKFKVTSEGVITATSGTIGGFTIDATSLHTEGQPTLADYSAGSAGVYVGTDGIAVSSAADSSGNIFKTVIETGNLKGYRNGSHVFSVTPNASILDESTGTTRYGGRLTGDVLDIRVNALTVYEGTGASGLAKFGKSDTITSVDLGTSISISGNAVTVTPRTTERSLVLGIYTGTTRTVTHSTVSLATTTYVDNAVASGGQDLSSYATKTWVQSQGYLTSVPSSYVPSSVKDSANNREITFSYNEADKSTATYVCVWDGYHIGNMTMTTLKSLVGSSQDLSSYATKTWVQNQGYITSVPSTYATKTWTQDFVYELGYLTSVSLTNNTGVVFYRNGVFSTGTIGVSASS